MPWQSRVRWCLSEICLNTPFDAPGGISSLLTGATHKMKNSAVRESEFTLLRDHIRERKINTVLLFKVTSL